MNIKSFNDIMKDLKGAGSTNNTGEIEALAEKLHKQGITSSMMEAREKAKSMINTEKGVSEDFTDKKEDLTAYNDPRSNPNYNRHKAAVIDEMRKRAMGKEPIKIQDEFQTPEYERKNGSDGLPKAVVTDKQEQI